MKTLLCSLAFSVVVLAQPQEGGRPPRGGPPPEALAACEGKAADAACSFTHGEHTITGTCFTPASDKPLACRPSGPPPERR